MDLFWAKELLAVVGILGMILKEFHEWVSNYAGNLSTVVYIFIFGSTAIILAKAVISFFFSQAKKAKKEMRKLRSGRKKEVAEGAE